MRTDPPARRSRTARGRAVSMGRGRVGAWLAAALLLGGWAGAAETPDFAALIQPIPATAKFEHPDYYIWCGTMAKGDDGKYHLFYSRWPRKQGFNAWLTHSEVAHAVSDSPRGPFTHHDVALPERGAPFWDGLNTHNPTVHRFGGKYYLYYTGNTGDRQPTQGLNWSHRNNQRIGVAVADKPEGPWTRMDRPLLELGGPDAHDALMMANPTVCARAGGGYLLIYKAVGLKKPKPFGGPVVHLAATSDSPTGPFTKQPRPVFYKEGVQFAAEDPFIWQQDGHYWAIVKDMGGFFTGQGKSTALFESGDGFDWKLSSHPLVATTEVTWEGGRKQKLFSLERPQLFFEGGRPVALLFACDEDEQRTHSFNVQIPLKTDEAAGAQARALSQGGAQQVGPRNTHPDAQWFPAAGLGLFIHWGLASVKGAGDLSWGMLANKPWTDETTTPNAYYGLAQQWKPDQLDYDRMLAAAKAAGVTYAVLVTKHHDGFTLWPSAFGDLGTKSTFNGRDFVQEFVTACRKHGLKVGLYYSPPDWWFDRTYKSFAMRGPALDMDHQPVTLPPKPADHDAKRAALVRGQVTELLSNYGKIDLIWFDGGRGEIPNEEVRRLQPGIVVNRRNGGGGDYGDSEGKLPTKRFQGWFETCETCWPAGKWSYTENAGWDSSPAAIEELVRLRAWGGNLLANVGPKGDGSVPPQALAAWQEMAEWMAHSRESVIGADAGPWPGPVNLPITQRPGVAYAHFLPGQDEALVWQGAPTPAAATLLRTGEAVPFTSEGGTLRIVLTPAQRTKNVDVVKVVFKP